MHSPMPATGCEQMPEGAKAFPFNYWDGMTPEQWGEMTEGGKGLHAGEGEVSMILAIRPDLIDREYLNTEFPTFPKTKTNSPALHTAFFFSSPGSVYEMSKAAPGVMQPRLLPKRASKSSNQVSNQ